MNITQLKSLEPEKLSFEELHHLMEKYPWFSLLHILWLLKFKIEKPAEYDDELIKHTVYLHDRKKLYHIITSGLWNRLILDSPPAFVPPVEHDNNEEEKFPEDEKELLEFSYDGIDADNPSQQVVGNTSDEMNENSDETRKEIHSDKPGDETSDDHLIDRFLEAEPGPIPANKESTLKGDVSGKSVREDESFITDTLARIYVKQGLYSKAIFAYEKLSLKYPEKSVYFASQIEEIRNLTGNKS